MREMAAGPTRDLFATEPTELMRQFPILLVAGGETTMASPSCGVASGTPLPLKYRYKR